MFKTGGRHDSRRSHIEQLCVGQQGRLLPDNITL